tara:strand:- start:1511 stop:1819 length:309 start_codon:yes stop_codon:yes gene_type:complete
MTAPEQMIKSQRHLPTGSGWLLLVGVLVVITALAVSYSAHWSRLLLNEMAAEIEVREKAQAEWGRLVLEQSTWTAYSRIERIATEQLGMHVPEPSDVILVQP